MVAPLDMAQKIINLIDREAEHARRKRPAHILAKMNALTDKQVIQALYRASQAGVQVDLIVRGMCALVPGIRGVSDRIRVRSIVGRFLEHSRIFYFANAGHGEAWLGSADWMPRNLYDRVETLFPIRDPIMCHRLLDEILAAYLADTEKARILLPDGNYVRAYDRPAPKRAAKTLFNAQEFLIAIAEGRLSAADIPGHGKPAPRRRTRAHVRVRRNDATDDQRPAAND